MRAQTFGRAWLNVPKRAHARPNVGRAWARMGAVGRTWERMGAPGRGWARMGARFTDSQIEGPYFVGEILI